LQEREQLKGKAGVVTLISPKGNKTQGMKETTQEHSTAA
jgi:hypothetical protein